MKPPFTRPKITPSTRLPAGEFALELVPGGFAAGAVAAQHGLAIAVLDAVDIDFDCRRRPCSSAFWPGAANSRSGTRPSIFRPTSMTARSFSIAVHRAGDDAALEALVLAAEGFVEERGEIVARGVCRSGHG